MASRKEHEMNRKVIEAIKNRRKTPRNAVTKAPYDRRFQTAPTTMADKELWEELFVMTDLYLDDV